MSRNPCEDPKYIYGGLALRVQSSVCCVEEVWRRSAQRGQQCSRLRGHGYNGLYCKQHAKRDLTQGKRIDD